jgi:hypothetical protein
MLRRTGRVIPAPASWPAKTGPVGHTLWAGGVAVARAPRASPSPLHTGPIHLGRPHRAEWCLMSRSGRRGAAPPFRLNISERHF